MRVKFAALAIAAVSILFVLVVWAFMATQGGVIREPNFFLHWHFVGYFGAACLWFLSLVAAIAAVHAFIRKRYAASAAHGTAALLALASPLVADATHLSAARLGELRDLRKVGVESLRSEAADLAAASQTKDYQWRWFGHEVPPEDLPPGIASLAVEPAYVTTSNEGTVLVKDGMGSWRGGYLITPPGSTFVPKFSRRITDGVFYVITR